MLKDKRPDKHVFSVATGFPGKRPASDRDAVIKELKTQGKWPEENQTGNKTNDTEMAENTGTSGKQEENLNSTQKSNTTPFISPIWVLAAVLGAVASVRKKK